MTEHEPTPEEDAEHHRIHGPWAPNYWQKCDRCNYDDHRCPGCGEWLYHGTYVCGNCREES